MAVPVDDIDRRLLAALLADGRASTNDVAAAADVAPATATKRLSRLEAEGIIEGYQPVVDYAKLGSETTAVFRLSVDGEGLRAVVADLQGTGRMTDVYEITGEYDVVAVGTFTDTDELNDQIKELVTHPHVRSATTSIVLETVCEHDTPRVGPDPAPLDADE